MVDVKNKIALVLIAIMILTAPVAIAQKVPPHVVISEVQIATNEFVELYNPTNTAINMTGWHWCYFSPSGNWNNSLRDRPFPEEAIIIPAHGFYLIATTSGDFPTADWNLEYATHFLSNTAGSVGIFPWDPDTKTAEEAKAGKIDAVGWGSGTYVYETATASTPGSGKSIERKPLKDGYAPCQDTDDNSVDFDLQDTPTPKNSLSPEMDPAPVKIFNVDGNLNGSFVNIQDAVDNASAGCTIRVDDGIYNENVDVDKQLTIRSEHGAAVTTISAPNPNDNVIAVTVDRVTITGFNVIGATAKGGIYLCNADYCNIANNSASNNKIGIHLQMGSQHNTIMNNTVSNNIQRGIWLAASDHNTITNNTVSDNENGISLSSSDDNLIYNNYFDNTNNADDNGNNIWNITKTPGTNIIGGPYLGGNYWSGYAGADTDDDGLGDTLVPYNSSDDIENGGDSHPLVHEAAPSLSIEKSGEPNPVQSGGTLNYTISVKNTGYAPATNVNVKETYDVNVTFISAVPAPSQGNDTWKFDTLNVSETRRINISVTVNSSTPNGTVLHNSVNVICDERVTVTATEATTVFATFEPPEITYFAPRSPVNDTVDAWRTFNVTVNQTVDIEWYLGDSSKQENGSVQEASFKWQAVEGEHNVTVKASNENGSDSHSWIWNVKSISVTKVGDVSEAAPSTLVNFNITVINIGDSNLTQVVVNDMLPEGMTFSHSVPDPNTTQDGMDITWYFNESLAVNASKTIELVAKIAEDADGVLNNTVNVTGTPETGTNVSASATAQVRVIRLGIEKSCSSSTVSLGGTVTYTIEYSNPGGTNLTNVVITENYPDGLTFISADPAPDSGTNNTWTIGTLPAGELGKITIKMKVPDSMSDISYEESGSVVGEGIVIISKEMSTEQKPYKLENIVTISGSYGATNVSATASAITTVMSGSSLEITEHGSGSYESEEELSLSSKNGAISFDKTTNAKYSPTTFKCSDGFVMEVSSKWSQDICIKNYAKEIAIHKTITEATTLEDDTRIDTKNNGYSMTFDSTFLGYLHVGKKTKVAATSEHYIGDFVITDWDESGDEIIVDGVGYVIVDKELDSGRLLLMEHGSGSYESEEDSSSKSINKETYAVYEPTQFNFSDSFVVNFSSKWMQDFCTRSKTGTTALHKKIRDATYIDDDTIAKSSPSLKYDTYFYGAAHWGERVSKARTSNDYIGEFYMHGEAKTNRTDLFEWGKVPGGDEHQLKTQLKRHPFNMEWVDDATFNKSDNNRIIYITDTMGNHSAEIILSENNETAILTTDDGRKITLQVEEVTENNKKELLIYYIELIEVIDKVVGEGFVMVDEFEGGIHLIEHGSGSYYSDENFVPNTIYKYTYGEYKPTYFKFADSFAVNFSSLWVQDICVKDKKEDTAIHKRISDASFMKDDTTVTKSSKPSKTLMNITSSFNGSMHIGARTENVSLSEDYIGEFNVTELIKIVKEKPKSSSESSDWLFCPCPISSSTYPWLCQDPTYGGRWLSGCPYPYTDTWPCIPP